MKARPTILLLFLFLHGLAQGAPPTSSKLTTTEALAVIQALQGSFKYKYDPFEKKASWVHKRLSMSACGEGTTIKSYVWGNRLRIRFCYCDSSWIFFDRVILTCDGKSVEAKGKPDRRVSDGVIEDLDLGSPVAEKFINFIKEHVDHEIKVRMIGKYKEDFTLRDDHKNYLINTMKLQQALAQYLQKGRKLPDFQEEDK